jgi:hypothetical protein
MCNRVKLMRMDLITNHDRVVENRCIGILSHRRNSLKAFGHLVICLFLGVSWGMPASHERQPQTAKVNLQSGQPACVADLDGVASGATDANGKLVIAGVDPGDHYLHVQCPGKPEATFFISPKANDEVQISTLEKAAASAPGSEPDSHAEDMIQLRRLVQQAMQLRAQARLDEAVSALRQAMKLDPANSDLHRELGITFLLAKEWKRARVEMIEAIRHDQSDADAHNGLGYALEKLGDIDAAVKEYRIASHLDPDDSTYRTHYFDALVKIQARQEAIKK